MPLLQYVVVGANAGLRAVEIAASDTIAVLSHKILMDDAAPHAHDEGDGRALRLYSTRTPNNDDNASDGGRWLDATDGQLIRALSVGLVPPRVKKLVVVSKALATDAVVRDVFADAPTNKNNRNVIHLLLCCAPRACVTRTQHWRAINYILATHVDPSMRLNDEDVLEEDRQRERERDDEEEEEEDADRPGPRRLVLDALYNAFRGWIDPYVEQVSELSSEEIETLSRVLGWTYRAQPDVLTTASLWVHGVAPIVWCAVQRFTDARVILDATLDGDRVEYHGCRTQFQIRRGSDTYVSIVRVVNGMAAHAMARACVACEIQADTLQLQQVGAIVTDGVQWFFLRSQDDRILLDQFQYLKLDPTTKTPTEHSVATIVGKIHSMLL